MYKMLYSLISLTTITWVMSTKSTPQWRQKRFDIDFYKRNVNDKVDNAIGKMFDEKQSSIVANKKRGSTYDSNLAPRSFPLNSQEQATTSNRYQSHSSVKTTSSNDNHYLLTTGFNPYNKRFDPFMKRFDPFIKRIDSYDSLLAPLSAWSSPKIDYYDFYHKLNDVQ
ncbi:hypothetical protein DICVIV_13274 [Dictyocaulus viviparus]|uniref:Uncharacterized protein n=1 Tax=Dictyocaulus viviparus TaxID=29172 RepID=A0A0D8X896_DICVI|nr:hypothetical protein DICVIV_13274 [Dictyocaulus viviparus]